MWKVCGFMKKCMVLLILGAMSVILLLFYRAVACDITGAAKHVALVQPGAEKIEYFIFLLW